MKKFPLLAIERDKENESVLEKSSDPDYSA